jgi:hypothetical protein
MFPGRWNPIFYLLLAPLFLSIIIALIVIARGSGDGSSSSRPVRSALIIVGLGALLVVILFVGWSAMYYAGGGH